MVGKLDTAEAGQVLSRLPGIQPRTNGGGRGIRVRASVVQRTDLKGFP
jgi:hypothetical protein